MRRASGAAVAAMLAALALAACRDGPSAPKIDDAAYSAAAARVCARTLPPLRPDLSDKSHPSAETIAKLVDDRADKLGAMARELRAIPRGATSEREVTAWLRDWDGYVSVGRRYAAALRTGDPGRQRKVSEEGSPYVARISRFARANGMKSCALDGVPLPPREGL